MPVSCFCENRHTGGAARSSGKAEYCLLTDDGRAGQEYEPLVAVEPPGADDDDPRG